MTQLKLTAWMLRGRLPWAVVITVSSASCNYSGQHYALIELDTTVEVRQFQIGDSIGDDGRMVGLGDSHLIVEGLEGRSRVELYPTQEEPGPAEAPTRRCRVN